jgi:hypothetical protein
MGMVEDGKVVFGNPADRERLAHSGKPVPASKPAKFKH